VSNIKALVIGGMKSGCGKTTLSLGMMAALARRGQKVAPFKIGPDFIDPGHHSRMTGATSRNLDGWMLTKTYNQQCFAKHTEGADIAVIEGVMGLFDGYDGKSDAGSTAQMAKWLGIPVVLVVDAKSLARSAAAVVMGFERFDDGLSFAGVIFNNVGSRRHLEYLKDATRNTVGMPCLGGILHDERIAIPERHLGLFTREDFSLANETTDHLVDLINSSVDLDLLVSNLPQISVRERIDPASQSKKEKTIRIGVARDNAFCFYYPDNLELLANQGAEIVCFSPIVDEHLPENIDGLYLGGGYPELYAEKLADNGALRKQIKERSDDGMPIYGECGGFMYLCRDLCDLGGKRYPMTGCFPFETKMFSRLKALGYREISITADTIIGKTGQVIRGHEFHYSELSRQASNVATVYRISDRSGMDREPGGYLVNQTLGSYNHLHFGSRPQAAACFAEKCLNYRQKREKTHET
jgi:cobyrinic acid a,c-diamide synthase